MPNDPTTTTAGPWRILVLDRDPQDPKLILATVAGPADVTPAWPGTSDRALEVATAWVLNRLGGLPVALTPIDRAACWRIDQPGQPR